MTRACRSLARSKPGITVRGGSDVANARRQREAIKGLSELELATGHSPEWWAEFHRVQRERVRRRYGLVAG